ncbi:E1-E2 ATPase family protein (macronuclear) [Tetrahymena thermophila SB210]|uniref:E1-E2 ATPase family protein n=1 Tax=Tetrahymena thermophila (strain SB210) TaxID=312017 RepID=I7LXP3_TETTS|nr:E1-E2 ATPase family protein [Tetrahymena thermophila SB210]EAS05037.2 E1-E2 ATPase family protein [Tetrahymena thermophila SB210]|eukprot:XP_001025282.2 E1-E2 ATPase family protein [Tetrahymena thermophila SB210]
MTDYQKVKKDQNVKLSSLIISAFTQDMNDLQQKEIQRKINSLTDGFKKIAIRQALKRNKYLSNQSDEEQSKLRQGESYKFIDAHRIILEELLERYQTDIYKGLTDKDAKLRSLKQKNKIKIITQNSMLKRFLKELLTLFHLLILLASILCFILYSQQKQFQMLVTAILLLCFVIISSIIGSYRQRKGQNILENIEKSIPKNCIVTRDGEDRQILSINLVPGDIIKLSEGMTSPADVRIIASTDLYVNKEIYTGSSIEEYMHPECSNKENPLNTNNIIFLGSKIVRGKAKCLVISTGVDTLIQDLGYKCSQEDYFPDSQLKKDFDQFLNIVSIVLISITIFTLLINLGKSEIFGMQYHLQYMIGMIVSGLPLGMIILKTSYLLIVQKQLNEENIDVNYIEAIAILGQTTCICTDMTGTLTLNKPIVSNIWYDDKARLAKNKQLALPTEKLQYNIQTDKTLIELMYCATLCNDSNFDDRLPQQIIKEVVNNKKMSFEQKKEKLQKEQEQYTKDLKKKQWIDWPCSGIHHNENALIKFFQPLKDIRIIRDEQPIVRDFIKNKAKIPFSISSKFSSVICRNNKENSHYTLYTKGAPSVVWNMCDKVMYKGEVQSKNSSWEIKFEKILQLYGEKGERVLAFAKLDLPQEEFDYNFQFNMTNPNFPLNNQVFIGLISQLDPPDYGSANMVRICKQAGIKVIMLTGEESLTATQIAKSCNVITMQTQIELNKELNVGEKVAFQEAQALVIDGEEVAKILTREEGLPKKQKGLILKEYLRKPEVIFSKVQPAHKEQIVKTLQKTGYLVTATGLTIRDTPALRQAEVGVSFAIQGDQVAKDTSDIKLQNDQFITLVKGIEKGRLAFDNLKKSVTFCLSSTVSQIAAFIFFYLSEMPFGLTPIQVFILDIGLIHLPALLYVYLQPEIPVMERKPELSNQVNKKMIFSSYLYFGWFSLFAGFLAYFSVLSDFGLSYSDVKGLSALKVYVPFVGDEYDPQSPWLGNSLLRHIYPCDSSKNYETNQTFLDWQYDSHIFFDLRLAFAECQKDGSWKSTFIKEESQQNSYNLCQNLGLNIFNSRPNCYTTETFKYAQTAYLYASSLVMIIQYYISKSKIQSVLYDRIENLAIPSGIFLQILTLLIFTLIESINDTFSTRKLDLKYYGWFGVPFAILLVILEELKKKLIRDQLSNSKQQKQKNVDQEADPEKKSLKEEEKKDKKENEGFEDEKDNLIYKNMHFNQEMQNKFKFFIKKNENTWIKRNILI